MLQRINLICTFINDFTQITKLLVGKSHRKYTKGVKNKHQKVVNKEKTFNLNLNQLTLNVVYKIQLKTFVIFHIYR